MSAQQRPAHAEGSVTARPMAARPELDVRPGFVAFLKARSLALEHIVKPWLGADWLFPVTDSLKIGPGVRGVTTLDDNYGVWSVQGRASYDLVQREVFNLRATVGLGVGYNPPILHSDLQAEFPVVPYYSASLASSWALSTSSSGAQWHLGVGLEHEQLSVVGLAAQLRWVAGR